MKHNIIFICTGNSCRSQIAEGLLKNEAGDKFNVYSAGSHPSRIHPASIKVMAEWGIDISNQKSEIIDKYLNEKIDIVLLSAIMQINPALVFLVRELGYIGVLKTPFITGVMMKKI